MTARMRVAGGPRADGVWGWKRATCLPSIVSKQVVPRKFGYDELLKIAPTVTRPLSGGG